ncbi:uncharacterized protein LOC129798238 [Phlebotomus papatasi]|uniref:uncharacterized protein LOC129798238 n=1 Tax=Phlebotomus papatasi TaxID=29031 RepID=UPI0024834955|nr:uncharacterized protein LOC129798238 [Phlebotomus papatasi]XP_055697251.1 uncharacterized protein LOC129798238 [Phlebotomus papatasi]
MSFVESFLVVVLLAAGVLADEDKEPTGIKYDKFVVSPGSEKYVKYEVNSEQVNETAFKMSMVMDQLEDFDNQYEIQMAVYYSEKNDGNYEEIFATPKEMFCDYMNGEIYKEHIYPQYKDISNFPPPGECPVKKGQYKLEEHVFNVGDLKALGKPGGWRIDNSLYKGGALATETQMFFTVY